MCSDVCRDLLLAFRKGIEEAGLRIVIGNSEMSSLHQQLHGGDWLQQPPGQILTLVLELAEHST
jgi:hypothetical protein